MSQLWVLNHAMVSWVSQVRTDLAAVSSEAEVGGLGSNDRESEESEEWAEREVDSLRCSVESEMSEPLGGVLCSMREPCLGPTLRMGDWEEGEESGVVLWWLGVVGNSSSVSLSARTEEDRPGEAAPSSRSRTVWWEGGVLERLEPGSSSLRVVEVLRLEKGF